MPVNTNYLIEKYKNIIIQNMPRYYPDISKSQFAVAGKSLGGKYANTFKFKITSNIKNVDLYLKICPVFESLDPAKMEFETLMILHDKIFSNSENLAVAKPVDYFSQDNAYLQESVGNYNLRTYLLKYNSLIVSTVTKVKIQELISGSAKWLKLFHAKTRSQSDVAFSPDEFISSISGEFDYADLKQFKFRSNILEKLEALLGEISAIEQGLKVPCAKWHWDYTPGHVFIDNQKISVIDILGVDNVPIYEDIGHYLASLTCINNLPFHLLFSHKRAQNILCSKFIDEYLSENDLNIEEARFFINLYKIKYLVVYFLDQYAQVSGKTNRYIGKLFANYRLLKLIQDPLMRAIEEASDYLYKSKCELK